MSLYSKKFIKFLNEQDDVEAMQSTLDPETDVEDFDIDVPETSDGSPVGSQQREMFDELSQWIQEMDKFSNYLNGTDDSIQTSLNSAESDTIFDSISNSEMKSRIDSNESQLTSKPKDYSVPEQLTLALEEQKRLTMYMKS